MNDDAVQTSTSFSAAGRDGGRHRAECVRAAGRSSAPPGRGQAAKAVFRRSRMARLRRMRRAAYAARSHSSAVPPAAPSQPRRAPRAHRCPRSRAHRYGKGRNAKRARPKPISRLASGAHAQQDGPSRAGAQLGRRRAHAEEERPPGPPHSATRRGRRGYFAYGAHRSRRSATLPIRTQSIPRRGRRGYIARRANVGRRTRT